MPRRALKLTTYRFGEPRADGEGLRIGVTRYPPRGIKKTDYAARNQFDVWLPLLSPSRELVHWYLHEGGKTEDFFRRYRKEMSARDPRQTIALLAKLALSTPIAIGCSCEDAERCHRTALAKLIRDQS